MRNATHVICLRNCALLAIFLMGAPPVTHAAERITYYHTDALGSPVAATDQQGNVVWRETYEPYGERIKKEPASSTNARWHTGHVLDAETGLQYAGARYYDPVLGRFMGVDPASFAEKNPRSFNRYAYGNNNPYKYIDPDGRAGVEFQPGGLVRCVAEGGCRQLGGGGGGAATQRSLPQTAASPASATAKPTLGETKQGVEQGAPVYRVWGDGADASGRSWTTVDPRTVPNYRDAAGLPNENSGRFLSEGTLKDTSGVKLKTADPLHGNSGGLPEVVIPNPKSQIELRSVQGLNPNF